MNDADPIQQFHQWYERAHRAGIAKPNAMTLATADADGRPSARIVLLSSFDERGFVFHTNYQSRKAEELERNPHATLVLWWDALDRQVRIEGRVEKTSAAESDEYFRTRPRGRQLAAWASDQSRSIESCAVLDDRMQTLTAEHEDQPVPRPPHWGGYRLIPESIEFWEHRRNRLHDRICYRRESTGAWSAEHLAP